MRFNNSKNTFPVRVRNVKKLKGNPVRAWQRYIAAFMAYFLILQICLPSAAIAATMLSNDDFSQVLKSPLYRATGKPGGAIYTRPAYLQVDTQSGVTLANAYAQLSPTQESLPDTTLVIGDEFVQQRLIRAQLNLLLGRSLIDKAGLLLNANSKKAFEQNQNDELFAAGIKFGLNTSKKFGTPLASQDTITNNMIWSEKRTINGTEVIIPVVYLNSATLATKPEGHYIQFGLSTAFNNLEIHKGVVISALGNENYQAVIQSLTNIKNAGTINGSGNLELVAGNMLLNLSGQIKATNNLDIRTERGDVINKTQIIPYQSSNGSGTRLAAIASIDSVRGNIKITSGGGIAYEGGISNALNGGLAFNANGDIVLAPVGTTNESTTKEGHWVINRSSFELLQSKLTANQLIALMAGGSITLTAAELHSTQGGIQLLAKHGIYIADEQGHFQSNRVDKIGRTQGTGSDFESFAVRTVLSAGKGVLLATETGDITLKGAKITSAEGTQIKARNGKVRLLVTKENSQHYLDTVRKGTWTIKTVHEEYLKETGIPNAIIGGLAVEALTGVDIEYAGREGAELVDQIKEYDKMPDTKWMADVYYGRTKFKDANGNLVPLDFSKVDLAYKYIREHNTNLSPAAMAIIAICVAVALGGAGAGLIGTGSSAIGGSAATASGIATLSFPAAAMQAGVLTLATSAAQNLAAGKNLEDTFKAITSDDGLKNLATSMATAGALSAMGGKLELFDANQVTANPQLAFVNQAYQAVGNSVVNAGVSVTINGGNLDDYKRAFTQNLATYAINTVGQNLAKNIASADSLSKAAKYISNAALGCITQGLTAKLNAQDAKDACASGAGGAVLANGIADLLEQKTTQLVNKVGPNNGGDQEAADLSATLSFLSKNNVDISKLFAGLIAYAARADINAALGGADLIGEAQKNRIMRTVALGEVINAMGMANCADMSLNDCGKLAAINKFREGLLEDGKYSPQSIDAKIAYLKNNTTFFDDLGAFNAAFIQTKGSLEGLTNVPRIYPDPDQTVINPNAPLEVVVTGDKWNIMRQSLYGVGETTGKAVNTVDTIIQDGINKILEKPYGAPLKWGLGKIAEAAQKYPEVAKVINAPNEFFNAIGTGGAAVLMGDEYVQTKDYLANQSVPQWDQSAHESLSNVSTGVSWLVSSIGVSGLSYVAKSIKFTRVANDGKKLSNGETAFYRNEIAKEFTNTSTLGLRKFLADHPDIKLRDGWDADRLYDEVLGVPKELRPEPDKYLSAEYIAAHLKAFDRGVVRVTKNEFAKDGNGTLSLPGETFVMTLDEWNKAKNLAQGDPVKLATILKLEKPETYFANKADVFAAVIQPGDYSPLKVPTGRELGANNDWLPGLLTGGGFKEAITVFTPNAAKNSVRLPF